MACVLLALALAAPAAAQPREVLTDIRVHGNTLTPDEEIKQLAGVAIGSTVTPATASDVAGRLTHTGRFRNVEVLKRFASIADPTQIVLVIVVDEGAVTIEMTGDIASPVRVVKSRWLRLLFFPILDAEDGYGLTYGARLGLADKLGARSRISFPLTWGGEKKAGAEFDKAFPAGPLHRVTGGVSIAERTNPFFDRHDDRRRVWGRIERQIAGPLRAGAGLAREGVTFGGVKDRFTRAGVDLRLDTRLDSMLPRNAVDVQATIERLNFDSAGLVTRTAVDARGYVGLYGQTILAVRAARDAANRPLPLYAKALFGGMSDVRGFHAGTAAGDTLVAGSLELIVPLTSPLDIGRLGVSVFVDAGTAYDHGARFSDQELKRGVGGSVWLSAAVLRLSVAVAHGIGATTRVSVSAHLVM